ncbi:MAG: DNA methyltransferase [Candidatus Hodarchaeota archaeon]
MPNSITKYNIKPISDISFDESNAKLIFGKPVSVMKELALIKNLEKPRLVFTDFSNLYLNNTNFLEKKDVNLKLEAKIIKNSCSFFAKSFFLFRKCKKLLSENGIFAVLVNNSIKSQLKVILDELYGIDHFINEIIVDSPFNLFYDQKFQVFERTNSILLYSLVSNPRINPVLNEKESGGYWHSFVSKGQGKPKKFIFNKKEVILTPPPGTHWKLSQDDILELCLKGKIRLNTKGNPEYWVSPKKGQIIDTNWLDIPSYESVDDKSISTSEKLYERFLRTYLNKGDLFIDLCTNVGLSLLVSAKLKMKWIGVEKNKQNLGAILTTIRDCELSLTVFDLLSKGKSGIKYAFTSKELIKNTKLETSRNNVSLILIEQFPKKCLENNIIKSNDWKNILIYGDSFDVLELISLRFLKKLKLIYIDPPFFTGVSENIIIPYKTDRSNILQFQDIAYINTINDSNPINYFLTWFKTRVLKMKPLLRDDGFIFVRFDYHFGHYAKMVLDEVFGKDNFVNEFLIRRMKKNLSKKQAYRQTHLIVHTDSLFVYRKSAKAELKTSKIKKRKRKGQNKAEIQYYNDNLWLDIAGYEKAKKTLYPTENSETLLNRVIQITTNKGDLVADFFSGSGTTLAVAEKLGRKWIGIDLGKYSMHEIKKRILRIPKRGQFNLYGLRSYSNTLIDKNSLAKGDKYSTQPIVNFKVELKKKCLYINVLSYIPSNQKYNFSDFPVSNNIDFIDYWLIDWNYQNKIFCVCWYSLREMKGKIVTKSVEGSASFSYSEPGNYKVAIRIVDVFGTVTNRIVPIKI